MRQEIEMLQQACAEYEEEVSRLQQLRSEQKRVSKELDHMEMEINQQRNELEVECRGFEHECEQSRRLLATLEHEVDQLTSSDLKLLSIEIDLRVDQERGLRYPNVNGLRLAYRPKGDIDWEEIQAAWSLAAQLLLSIGAVFQFESPDWKIVPLVHGAKLIHCESNRTVFDLGRTASSLIAWNTLLCRVTGHVQSRLQKAVHMHMMDPVPELPFALSDNQIGGIQLHRLNDDDDPGWSRAIHFMSSNLLWLSQCTSLFMVSKIALESSLVP